MGDTAVSDQPSLEELRQRARRLRRHIIQMTTAAGSGHPSSSLSTVEVLTALYFGGILRYDAHNPQWAERDRFILSKGCILPLRHSVASP